MRATVLMLALMALFACTSDTETVEVRNFDTGLVELFERSRKTGLRQGFYRLTDRHGVLLEESEYRDDVLHGARRLYDETGRLVAEETHAGGKYHGRYRSFYPDGRVDSEGQYENNEMTGIWKRYYPDGQVMEEVTFVQNLENGPFLEFYPNGQRKAEGRYLDGDNEHGELLEYNEQGVLVARKQCERGICKTLWSLDGGPDQTDRQ